MDFLTDNWGSLASVVIGVIGVLVSAVGLFWAIRAARGARSAAEAAEEAATETRRGIRRELTVVDIERANARIEALKGQHRNRQWEAALATYHDLRNMLYDIRERHPRLAAEWYNDITWAADRIYDIEDAVEQSLQSGPQPDAAALNRILSQIQSKLRNIHVGDGSRQELGEE